MAPKLAVLAGGGPLPAAVIQAARESGREIFVLAFEGETDPGAVDGVPHQWVSLGAVGRTLRVLRDVGAEEVCLIGPVRRPSLSSLRLDLRGMQLLAKLGVSGTGDDRLFKVVVDELESEGFRVVGADQMVGALLAPEGVIGKRAPDAGARRDIELAVEIARRLGTLDIGQAVVVQQGLVLGVEAVEGTDRLLARCGELRRDGPGGVLVKLKKPGQERRADLPTIGPGTVDAAADAGLQGIAVHAGHCLIVDRPATIVAADAAGLFLIGVNGTV